MDKSHFDDLPGSAVTDIKFDCCSSIRSRYLSSFSRSVLAIIVKVFAGVRSLKGPVLGVGRTLFFGQQVLISGFGGTEAQRWLYDGYLNQLSQSRVAQQWERRQGAALLGWTSVCS